MGDDLAARPLALANENAELCQRLATGQNLLMETAIDAGQLHARNEAVQVERLRADRRHLGTGLLHGPSFPSGARGVRDPARHRGGRARDDRRPLASSPGQLVKPRPGGRVRVGAVGEPDTASAGSRPDPAEEGELVGTAPASRVGVGAAEQVAECLAPEQRAQAPTSVFRPVVDHVAYVVGSGEIISSRPRPDRCGSPDDGCAL